MNSRPIEAAVLRHQSHSIITSLPIYQYFFAALTSKHFIRFTIVIIICSKQTYAPELFLCFVLMSDSEEESSEEGTSEEEDTSSEEEEDNSREDSESGSSSNGEQDSGEEKETKVYNKCNNTLKMLNGIIQYTPECGHRKQSRMLD
jgi:hypothetical protein